MNKIDLVSKESRTFFLTCKDSVTTTLTAAYADKSLELSEEQLSKVLQYVSIAFEQGYQKALPSFQNSIKKHV